MPRVLLLLLVLTLTACTPMGDAEPTAPSTAAPKIIPPSAAVSRAATPGVVPSLDAAALLRGAWEPLPDAPITGRTGHLAVWTGTEMLVWGGFGCPPDAAGAISCRDGGAYDPLGRTWRAIAAAPIEPDFNQHGVWSGEELLVWGSQSGSGTPTGTAAYDPATDRWRRLPPAPLPRLEPTGAAWTGTELLVWGSTTGLDDGEDRGRFVAAAYDPATGAWRQAAPSPLAPPRFYVAATWTGSELLAVGGSNVAAVADVGCAGPICNDVPRRADGAAAYDPATDAWRMLPPPPDQVLGSGGSPVWTGTELLLGADRSLLRYRPEDGTAVRSATLPLGRVPDALHWTGAALLAFRNGVAERDEPTAEGDVYDPVDDAWRPLPEGSLTTTQDQTTVWTGRELLVWGGVRAETSGAPVEPRSASGVAYVPDAAPAPTGETTPDVDVAADAQLAGPAPSRVTTDDPGPIAVGTAATHLVQLEAEEGRALLVGRVEWSARPTAGPGVLLVAGPRSGWQVRVGEREQGLQTGDEAYFPQLLDADLPLDVPLTLRLQPPPFATTPGTYEVRYPLEWWDRREPPTPYPAEPDGTVELRVTYDVTGLSEAGGAARPEQEEARAALAIPPCRYSDHLIATGDPVTTDGALAVETDGLGWFGRLSFGARQAVYQPPGPGTRGVAVIGESLLFLDGLPLRECGSIEDSPATLVEQTPSRVVTSWRRGDLVLRLTQKVETGDRATARLVQTFAFSNEGTEPVASRLVRWFAGEITPPAASPNAITDRAPATLALVHDPQEDGTAAVLLELGADPSPQAWTVQPSGYVATIDENGRILGEDAGGTDLSVPPVQPSGRGVAQEWALDLGPGATRAFTATLTFSTG